MSTLNLEVWVFEDTVWLKCYEEDEEHQVFIFNQSINQSINHLINQSVSQSVCLSINQETTK